VILLWVSIVGPTNQRLICILKVYFVFLKKKDLRLAHPLGGGDLLSSPFFNFEF